MSLLTVSRYLAVSASLSSTIATLATLEPRNNPPQPPCSYPFTSFVYSGCFYDAVYNRSLPFQADIEFNNATVEACAAACKGNNYRYAGLEYYGQCFCGASVSGGVAPEADCNLPCNGDGTEACGGQDRISIYQDPTFPDADDIAVSSDYMSLGCYTEGYSGRSLDYSQYDYLDASQMTTELCLNTCGAKGFPFAGTEYGGECYCGVVLGNGTTPAPAGDCSMPCNGNSSEICGGPQRLNLYVATDLESTDPCAPPPIVSSSSIVSSTSVVSSTSTSATLSSTSSSTLSTITTTCSIPSNTYSPPPAPSSTKPTTTTKAPAPTSSCICSTPAPWAGSKCVGGYQMPCVGCNDASSQRSSYPFKLFNQKSFNTCPIYKPGHHVQACQDSCTTQYNWCMSYANSCKSAKYPSESYSSANNRCRQQYADCYKANQNLQYDGHCTATGKNPWTSDQWFNWCKSWLSQWF